MRLPPSCVNAGGDEPLTLTDVSPDSIPVDTMTTLTLTGTGFTPSTNVLVGGTVYGSPTLVSDTELQQAVTKTWVDPLMVVKVRNPVPFVDSNELTIGVTAPKPPPTLTSVTPNTGAVTTTPPGPGFVLAGTGFLNDPSPGSSFHYKAPGSSVENTLTVDTPSVTDTSATVTFFNAMAPGVYLIYVKDGWRQLSNELPYTVT